MTPPISPQVQRSALPSTTTYTETPQGFVARRTSLLFNRKVGLIVEEEESPRTIFKTSKSRRPKTSPPCSDDKPNSIVSSPAVSSFSSSSTQDHLVGKVPEFGEGRTLRSSQSYSILVLQKRKKVLSNGEWAPKPPSSSKMVQSSSWIPPTPESMPPTPQDLRRNFALRSRSPSVPRSSSRVQWIQDQGRSNQPPPSTPPSDAQSSYFPLADWSEVDRTISTPSPFHPSPKGQSYRPKAAMIRTWSKDSTANSESSGTSGSHSGSSFSQESVLAALGRPKSLVKWEDGYQEKNEELEVEEEEPKELLDSSSSSYSREDSFRYTSHLSSKFPMPPTRTCLDEDDMTWPDSPISRSHSPVHQLPLPSSASDQEKEESSTRPARSGSGDSALSVETEGIVKAFLLNSSRQRKDSEATFGLEAELLLHHRSST